MPTRNISLTAKLDAFIEEAVANGDYQNASEVVRTALNDLQKRQIRYNLMMERLRTEIQKGADDIAAGRATILRSRADFEAFFDDLDTRVTSGSSRDS